MHLYGVSINLFDERQIITKTFGSILYEQNISLLKDIDRVNQVKYD